jgi:hypothetical protein
LTVGRVDDGAKCIDGKLIHLHAVTAETEESRPASCIGRTYLNGSLEPPRSLGKRHPLPVGVTFHSMSVPDGIEINERRASFLRDAAERATGGSPVTVTARDLLLYWGAKRRRDSVAARVERDLSAFGLFAQPDFRDGWIDGEVRLLALASKDAAAGQDASSHPSTELPADVSLKVGALVVANTGVVGVQREQTLEMAQTLMMKHDYSQLAVLAGRREVLGAVNWESIAQARMRNPEAQLRDATIRAGLVDYDEDLLPKIPLVVDAGFVFVRGADRTITGIVTTADLSEQFAALAGPSLLLGEIERRLRRILAKFAPDDLATAVDPSDPREVESAEDLSIGEIARFLEAPANWARLEWQIDRGVFVQELHEVREIRNDVMHFSPDPPDGQQVDHLRMFNKWLRNLDATT